ncbi:MAG: hypothetical protein AAF517_11375, partial [Planctomycetota bacterium]
MKLSTHALGLTLLLVSATSLEAADRKRFDNIKAARQAGADFDIQGEYVGALADAPKTKFGVQVIALGNGRFQAVFLRGGLPGAGWDGKTKALCDGVLTKAGHVQLKPCAEKSPKGKKRAYNRRPPTEFLASRKVSLKDSPQIEGRIDKGVLEVKTPALLRAKKVERTSPTLGMAPPSGSLALLPWKAGKKTSLDGWKFNRGVPWKLRDDGSITMTDRGGNRAIIEKDFTADSWTLHIEFRTAFYPFHRGQGRSNSGIFPAGMPEIQVLDTFGLDGL